MTDSLGEECCDDSRPHLLFFVGGIAGDPQPFLATVELLAKVKGSKVHVHICQATNISNGGGTTDGIEAGGMRVVAEVRDHVALLEKEGKSPKSLSFWGHSLGGLFLRYAMAELFDLEHGTICGFLPQLFITTATPHLSVASTFFSETLLHTANALGVYGRSGEQLFLLDDQVLIIKMGTDYRYIQPLMLFRYRALITNVSSDIAVDFCTAALQPRHAQWLTEAIPIDPRYPHVVYDSSSWTTPVATLDNSTSSAVPLSPQRRSLARRNRRSMRQNDPPPYYAEHPRAAELDQARRCLAELPWRVICVRFETYFENAHRNVVYAAEGDVVQYICEVVFREPFGTYRRAWTGFPSAGYGRPASTPAQRRVSRALNRARSQNSGMGGTNVQSSGLIGCVYDLPFVPEERRNSIEIQTPQVISESDDSKDYGRGVDACEELLFSSLPKPLPSQEQERIPASS